MFLFSLGLIDSIEMASHYKQISETAIKKYYFRREGGSNIDIMFVADAFAMLLMDRMYRWYSTKSPWFIGTCIIVLVVQMLYLPII